MKWFKHDSDANTDVKLKKVRHKYGITGYGLYWYCVELIAGSVSPKNITFELEEDAEVIALEWGLDQLKVQEMMKYMVDICLFDLAENNRIRCLKLARRLDDTNAKNPQIRTIIDRLNMEEVGETPNKSDKVRPDKIRLDKNRIKDIEPNGSCAQQVWSSDQRKQISDAYNLATESMTQGKFSKWSDRRIEKLKTRCNEDSTRTLQWWIDVVSDIPNHKGVIDQSWFSLDFLLESEDRLLKFVEGKYKEIYGGKNGGSNKQSNKPDGHSGFREIDYNQGTEGFAKDLPANF